MHDLLRRHNPCSRIHRRSSPRTVATGLATDQCLISVHGSGVFFCSSSLLGCSVHLLWISLWLQACKMELSWEAEQAATGGIKEQGGKCEGGGNWDT
ncbi:Os11g0170400 [Oryza sativa Japonica Group]|uniref:Os11g0170400 protein n=2 Tax=Oryza sativa subsp. japonica TaxID=39947 RepID=C7J9A1_ORYSJ|nr:hypothetical protein DAI22_11g047200 [Oryza sativa Japonica Group]BAH95101.1 Os11g0170400 [Oryza sativa Japonica Group]BAT12862.1 Os11g0170400 [Oryza sativa Japonica Group]|eukprot:NP_001176373.1 Os11g0170400 [Oryza sativa Japonica Group]